MSCLSRPSVMHIFLLVCIIALFGVSDASPTAQRRGNRSGKHSRDISGLSLPNNGGGLPPPTPGLNLKVIAIGRGTQNYTCDTANPSAAPVPNGAVASLFDASLIASKEQAAKEKTVEALSRDPSGTPSFGHHYFDAARTPIFEVPGRGLRFVGKKIDGKPAPADANPGLTGEGAVDWLKLGDAGGSQGVTELYRVQTAGGKAPATCDGQQAQLEVPYSTQYWMYGS